MAIIDIKNIIGETTAYDKKEKLERNKPKSWLKSVSGFANGKGGFLLFGINDNNEIVGIDEAESDAEFISETIKTAFSNVMATPSATEVAAIITLYDICNSLVKSSQKHKLALKVLKIALLLNFFALEWLTNKIKLVIL